MRRRSQVANRVGSPCRWIVRCFTGLCLSALLAHLPSPAHTQSTGASVAAGVSKIGSATDEKAAAVAQLEQSVFQRVNTVRKARGLRPVAFFEDLARSARDHSRDMAHRNVLSHADATGRGPGDRLDAIGIPWLRYGENVALCKGYSNPCETVVDAWLKSPGHAANLLDPQLAESAVGVAIATDGTYYLTQVFVTR